MLPVQVRENLKSGLLNAMFHTSRGFLNNLNSSNRDRYTKTPEYKVTAVAFERV